jgi:hypothetical protein
MINFMYIRAPEKAQSTTVSTGSINDAVEEIAATAGATSTTAAVAAVWQQR